MKAGVLQGCGAGASGVSAVVLGVVAIALFEAGGCGGDVGDALVEHDTLGTGTFVGEVVRLLGAAAGVAAVLVAVVAGMLAVLAATLMCFALRSGQAHPPPRGASRGHEFR